MATECTVPGGETILKGDAVCVTSYDTGANRPTVKRASAANLATSKTVLGVARDDAAAGSVFVLVAGEVAKNGITSLGGGDSRIIATDINNVSGLEEDQCRLIRVDRPDGSEHVVGTCDESGNLAVVPRASIETSALHTFNVCAFGADPSGDPSFDSYPAFKAWSEAITAAGGGIGQIPPGKYYLHGYVRYDGAAYADNAMNPEWREHLEFNDCDQLHIVGYGVRLPRFSGQLDYAASFVC